MAKDTETMAEDTEPMVGIMPEEVCPYACNRNKNDIVFISKQDRESPQYATSCVVISALKEEVPLGCGVAERNPDVRTTDGGLPRKVVVVTRRHSANSCDCSRGLKDCPYRREYLLQEEQKRAQETGVMGKLTSEELIKGYIKSKLIRKG